ncbi:MAG: hypothetical protein V7707_10770 [Motiliproteus sp.]
MMKFFRAQNRLCCVHPLAVLHDINAKTTLGLFGFIGPVHMDISEIKKEYSPIHAANSDDFGCCYFCGCEADRQDYSPPIKHYLFYSSGMDELKCMVIPACKECRDFLLDCKEGKINERFDYVKIRLAKKYRKALNIYHSWKCDDALEEMSESFKKSIKAGLSLGLEADDRLRYQGFDFEFDGWVRPSRVVEDVCYDVFGEKFGLLRDALLYASANYRVNINVLKERVMENGGDFTQAITNYHGGIERDLFEKKKDKLSREFALRHKQNLSFIKRTVDLYLDAMGTRDIARCLDKIYNERVKK